MARQRMMLRFARWHIWLGWLVGLPILMWTVTGLVMIARPLEEVRGDDLRPEPAPLAIGAYAMPDFGEPVSELQLVQQAIGPVWIVTTAEGARRRYFAPDATLLPPVIESEARQIAGHVYAGKARLETVAYIPYDEVPIELRRPVNAWRLHYSDDTNLYLEAATGELLAHVAEGDEADIDLEMQDRVDHLLRIADFEFDAAAGPTGPEGPENLGQQVIADGGTGAQAQVHRSAGLPEQAFHLARPLDHLDRFRV